MARSGGLLAKAAYGALLLLAAGGCGDETRLVSIDVNPPTATISVNATQQFTATGNFSDGQSRALTVLSWTSSNTGVATIEDDGLATGVMASGTPVTITASTSDPVTGDLVTGTASLTVVP